MRLWSIYFFFSFFSDHTVSMKFSSTRRWMCAKHAMSKDCIRKHEKDRLPVSLEFRKTTRHRKTPIWLLPPKVYRFANRPIVWSICWNKKMSFQRICEISKWWVWATGDSRLNFPKEYFLSLFPADSWTVCPSEPKRSGNRRSKVIAIVGNFDGWAAMAASAIGGLGVSVARFHARKWVSAGTAFQLYTKRGRTIDAWQSIGADCTVMLGRG